MRQLSKARERWLRQTAIRRARAHPKRQGMGDAAFIGMFLFPALVIFGLTVLLQPSAADRRRELERRDYPGRYR